MTSATATEQSATLTTPAPRAASLTSEIRAWLAAVGRGLTSLRVQIESFNYGVRQNIDINPARAHLPTAVHDGIEMQSTLRFSVAAHYGRGLTSAGAAFVVWHPPTEFNAKGHGAYRVRLEGRDAIRSALADFPLVPSAVIDGGPTVAAVWLLDAPLDLRNEMPRARALQRALAERLHADVEAGQELGALLPLPHGAIRNWGAARQFVRFDALDLSRRYTIEQLEQAVQAPASATPATRRRERERA